ncbi:MAG: pyridoxamine 5'-phosphate oxidase family protein [bacterium]|nr:pyridoxamine 5'-phosphate oxidase family protein [bacterium]
MGKVYEYIDDKLAEWIAQQHVFFVATAPLSAEGHVNSSPKGGDSFRVVSGSEVAYQDYTGSGVETIAHLRENGRIVIMFCAFKGPPKIVRLHGHGTVVTNDHTRYAELARHFPSNPGTRSIIHVSVERISDSCGYAVPLCEFKRPRDTLDRWAVSKGDERLKEYRRENNAQSLDGLPGIEIDA